MNYLRKIIKLLKPNQKKVILRFIIKANDAYMKAIKFNDVTFFQSYACVPLIKKLAEFLCDSTEKPFLGLDKFRNIEWVLLSESSTDCVYLKKVTHSNIKLSKNFEIPIADDCTELWLVANNREPIILDIEKGGLTL